MRRSLVAFALVLLVATAGCAGFGGGDGGDGTADANDGLVAPSSSAPNATSVNQTVQLSVSDAVADSEWTSLTVEYPRGDFTVESAQHENVSLGIDPADDDEATASFNESDVSGVNTNAHSFTIELDTDYTLESGDVVVVEYPSVDNPDEPGNYSVAATLNGEQTTNTTVTIG